MISDEDPFDAEADDPLPGTEDALRERLKAAVMFTVGQICEQKVCALVALSFESSMLCYIEALLESPRSGAISGSANVRSGMRCSTWTRTYAHCGHTHVCLRIALMCERLEKKTDVHSVSLTQSGPESPCLPLTTGKGAWVQDRQVVHGGPDGAHCTANGSHGGRPRGIRWPRKVCARDNEGISLFADCARIGTHLPWSQERESGRPLER